MVSELDRSALADSILDLLARGGATAYFGEPVSQLEHALQTAALAERDQAADPLVVAALLHDIGHLLDRPEATTLAPGVDAQHEEVGNRWLARHFGPAITEPIRLHVAAKRYLCVVEPGYDALLSTASRESLALQGGPMTAEEVRAFRASPWALQAAALRGWDDAAKTPGLAVPGLSHYRNRVAQLLENR
jgi:phosphonate degradation associated HDIG domain protein